MNYIHKLRNENRVLQTELTMLKVGINDLRSYLNSSKFHVDTTVQKDDVLFRIQEFINNADNMVFEQLMITPID